MPHSERVQQLQRFRKASNVCIPRYASSFLLLAPPPPPAFPFPLLHTTQTHTMQPAGFDLRITAQTGSSQSVGEAGRGVGAYAAPAGQ